MTTATLPIVHGATDDATATPAAGGSEAGPGWASVALIVPPGVTLNLTITALDVRDPDAPTHVAVVIGTSAGDVVDGVALARYEHPERGVGFGVDHPWPWRYTREETRFTDATAFPHALTAGVEVTNTWEETMPLRALAWAAGDVGGHRWSLTADGPVHVVNVTSGERAFALDHRDFLKRDTSTSTDSNLRWDATVGAGDGFNVAVSAYGRDGICVRGGASPGCPVGGPAPLHSARSGHAHDGSGSRPAAWQIDAPPGEWHIRVNDPDVVRATCAGGACAGEFDPDHSGHFFVGGADADVATFPWNRADAPVANGTAHGPGWTSLALDTPAGAAVRARVHLGLADDAGAPVYASVRMMDAAGEYRNVATAIRFQSVPGETIDWFAGARSWPPTTHHEATLVRSEDAWSLDFHVATPATGDGRVVLLVTVAGAVTHWSWDVLGDAPHGVAATTAGEDAFAFDHRDFTFTTRPDLGPADGVGGVHGGRWTRYELPLTVERALYADFVVDDRSRTCVAVQDVPLPPGAACAFPLGIGGQGLRGHASTPDGDRGHGGILHGSPGEYAFMASGYERVPQRCAGPVCAGDRAGDESGYPWRNDGVVFLVGADATLARFE